jgi:succinyl-diaminopimelate desuccinylase
MTTDQTEQLKQWIDEDRDQMIEFLREFLQARSPNPPGDTRDAAAVVTGLLDRLNLPYRIVSPNAVMPNIISSCEGGKAGKHLVLNGHIDVFPVDETDSRWTADPWSGDIRDGKIYARGACDMKPGTTASIFTYALLNRIREDWGGKLTLTCVSDEETFGPWGARYLMDHEPEVLGDCVLNGEPSSPLTIRFGEKGPLWLAVTIQTRGAHGAYVHSTESATKIAARLALALESVCDMDFPLPDNLGRAIEASRAAVDKAMGAGAYESVSRVTLNVGRIDGGLKVNMIPGQCRMEIDFPCPRRRHARNDHGAGKPGHVRFSGSDTGRNRARSTRLLRPLRRNGDHSARHCRRTSRFPADTHYQPWRNGRPAMAISQHSCLRIRTRPPQHGQL